MQEILNKIKKLFHCFFSYLPFIWLSKNFDDNFSNQGEHWRFSLLQITIVASHLHILTFYKNDKNKFCFIPFEYKKIENEEQFTFDNSQWEEQEKQYKEHLEKLKESDKDVEKEALLRQLADEQSRETFAITKASIYTAILFGAVAVLFERIVAMWGMCSDIPYKAIFCLFIYATLNSFGCIFAQLKVKSVFKSRFSDLKSEVNKKDAYILQIYYDWQHIRKYVDLLVSFVLTIEHWLIMTLFLFLLLKFHLPILSFFDKIKIIFGGII